MNRAKRTGFALLYVLTVIVLVGGAAYLLTDACRTMVFETREVYLGACARNLTASGRAWSRRAKAGAREAAGAGRRLDVKSLAIPHGELRVTIRGRGATIAVSCRQGKRVLRRRETRSLE